MSEPGCYFCLWPEAWRVDLERWSGRMDETCQKHNEEVFYFTRGQWSAWRTPPGQLLYEERLKAMEARLKG